METDLIQAYRSRLHIDKDADLSPNHDTLSLLMERHLQYIPFTNLSLHTATTATATATATTHQDDIHPLNHSQNKEPVIVLERDSLIQKLLLQNQGGCCLELNGLLAFLLQDLGYPDVRLVPCFVHAGRERGHRYRAKFRTVASHFVLLVTVATTTTTATTNANGHPCLRYWVDVGLGEPPLGPLLYSHKSLLQEQVTPEGMTSRIRWDPKGSFADGRGRTRHCLIQEWKVQQENSGDTIPSTWEPRLQWDVQDAPLDENMDDAPLHTLESFRYVIPILLHPNSSFSRKLIVCRLTPHQKVSLSGRKLKITQPRFPQKENDVWSFPKVTVRMLANDHEVNQVLSEQFGITLPVNNHLVWEASDASRNSQLWNHL